ncbi:hypothetical protein N7501_005717 [Penicillium viridicatum]|nr:hypothetical protein N7501_005717 [Penicillium viridicatum]
MVRILRILENKDAGERLDIGHLCIWGNTTAHGITQQHPGLHNSPWGSTTTNIIKQQHKG